MGITLLTKEIHPTIFSIEMKFNIPRDDMPTKRMVGM